MHQKSAGKQGIQNAWNIDRMQVPVLVPEIEMSQMRSKLRNDNEEANAVKKSSFSKILQILPSWYRKVVLNLVPKKCSSNVPR